MKTFSTIHPSDHTIEKYSAYADITWRLVSSSNGFEIVEPENSPELIGSVTLNKATRDADFSLINVDTGVPEFVLYASIKHIFYDRRLFFSGSSIVTSSLGELQDRSYVVSIGQNLYGDRIKPGSFELSIHPNSSSIEDDSFGNLFVDIDDEKFYVGNIFYTEGIAVIANDEGSSETGILPEGLKLLSGSSVSLTYSSDMETERHQINVRLKPTEFNFSPFNRSIFSAYTVTGSVTQSFVDLNIPTSGSADTWALYSLMGGGVIKPYVTSIGLYNEQYELLAVAKLSTPIQRTFDTEQIFIIRFDTE
jgi:hypothetical protein